MYPWQAVYDAAVLETNAFLMSSRIEAADRAIEERLEELRRGVSEMPKETDAIESAIGGLVMLRKERLNGNGN